MTSNKNAAWIAGAGVLAVLIVVASYFLLIGPKRAEAADLATQTESVKQSNAAIEQRTAQLKSQFATLDEQKLQLAEIRSTLPENADVPALLRSLEGYASSAGIELISVTPGTPENFAASADADPTAATGIIDIPLAVSTSGSFVQTELFVKNLQADLGRFLLVENLTLQVADGTDGAGVTSTITGKIFVLRDATTTTPAAETATSDDAEVSDPASTETVSS